MSNDEGGISKAGLVNPAHSSLRYPNPEIPTQGGLSRSIRTAPASASLHSNPSAVSASDCDATKSADESRAKGQVNEHHAESSRLRYSASAIPESRYPLSNSVCWREVASMPTDRPCHQVRELMGNRLEGAE